VTCCAYMTDPFSVDPADLPVGTGEQEEFIDIQTDQTAKTKHKDCFPINFWLSMASSYSTLASHAIPQLLIFPSTWECEQGFSALMTIKLKKRNRLVAPMHDFRCAVSKCMPRIEQLVENKQMQPSHQINKFHASHQPWLMLPSLIEFIITPRIGQIRDYDVIKGGEIF